MKKIILTMMACAGLCACTNEEIVGTGGTTAADELGGPVAYITVNIKDVGSSTRATAGDFAYGTADEQNVANAYFYFYGDDGKYLARGSVASVDGTASSGTTSGNIEWSSNTVVAVYGLTDVTKLPTKMVTVLNQPSGFSGINKSFTEMQAALAQATNGYADGSGNFVMSTSSYDAGGTIVNYTPLADNDFSLEPINISTDYPNGGVEVYVERLAAKVGVTTNTSGMAGGSNETLSSTTINGYTAYDITDIVENQFIDGFINEEQPLYLALVGWDINGTSRDSYMLKSIKDDSNWSGLTFVWNAAANYRSYWAESPNYGVSRDYPTSSNGNTDADENTAGLDTYLKYTSLSDPIKFGSYGYCAENTNTVKVLSDASSTGITNVLVKAQAYTTSADNEYVPLDLVKFHGMYYTAEDFCQKTVDDVVEYDFTVLVDEVIAALKAEYPDLSTYLDDLNACVIKDNVWVIPAVQYHLPNGRNVDGNLEPQKFDGSLLSLYNIGDGNVDLFFNGAQPYWGNCAFSYDRNTGEITYYEPNFTAINDGIIDKYPEKDIVYGGKDLDDYEFMFHIEEDGLGNLELMGLIAAGVVFQINGDYYMILGNNFSFETENTGDSHFTGNHTYTLRNYLLRAITVEADGIDSEFGSYYPTYYKNGLMYYSIPIEHLGTTTTGDLVEGQYGVVRNHWYNITLTDISDLGHGIADENEVIVPQPELDYYYLGATVNILSWKMINQSASLK